MTAAEQTWLVSNGREAARRQRDGSDRDGSGANMDLWQRLRQGGSNGCDNTVVERTWLVGSVSNRNDSGETAATVAVRNWITVPGNSGDREAAAMSRQQWRRRSKLGLAVASGRQWGNSETAVTETVAVQIWICGRGCGNTAVTAVTTRWRSELGLVVASATAIVAARRQQ